MTLGKIEGYHCSLKNIIKLQCPDSSSQLAEALLLHKLEILGMRWRAEQTGVSFLQQALLLLSRKKAVRDGVPPIELADGEKLLDMFKALELGIKPQKAYDGDEKFLDVFK